MKNAAQILAPLTNLLKGSDENDFRWDESCDEAFTRARTILAEVARLQFPSATAPLRICTDASALAVGAKLEQELDGHWKPIAFFSSRLRPAEERYSTFDRELLAMYLAIKHFRHMVEGRQFHVLTDHKPLTTAMNTCSSKQSPRQIRHLSFISEFTADVRYRPGEQHAAPDSLSPIATVNNLQNSFVHFEQMARDQYEDRKEILAQKTAITGLKIVEVPLENSEQNILCDVSRGYPRPLVPVGWRRRILQTIHNLAHPGVRTTRKMVTDRFVWHSVNKDVTNWCRFCLPCQQSKIYRHTYSAVEKIEVPLERHVHWNVDLVGPLPTSNGYKYVFTCVDRFTRWPEAIPMPDASAETCAKVFLDNVVARFGCPASLTSDRGAQFTSSLWANICKAFGTHTRRTTAYHPAANGLAERFHRQMKAGLKARLVDCKWTTDLAIVMLGIRAAVKEDIGCFVAELMYGDPLRLPGEFFETTNNARELSSTELSSFAGQLRDKMHRIRPPPTSHHAIRPSYVPRDLRTCKYVFVRIDAVMTPLQRPYQGPYSVIERHPKYFVINFGNRTDSVSIDRLKPAMVDENFFDFVKTSKFGRVLQPVQRYAR